MIAAAGTMASLLVLLYGSTYIESPPVIAGWIVVGLGLAALARGRAYSRAPAVGAPAPPPLAPLHS
jgi:hypothetical protein